MLDFYLCPDSCAATPEDPADADFLGGLSLELFERLRAVWVRCAAEGIVISYFADQRLDHRAVCRMIELTREERRSLLDPDRDLLLAILIRAEELKSGVACYCD